MSGRGESRGATMAGFIPNSVLDNMVNMIRDYDDHHRGDNRGRTRRSFLPDLEDPGDDEDLGRVPTTELMRRLKAGERDNDGLISTTQVMRLWKAGRWNNLRDALGAKAMVAGAAQVQIGDDPKTAKQKQKEKEKAIRAERREARAKVAKDIRAEVSDLLFQAAKTFADMDGRADVPEKDEYDHDRHYSTFERIMGPNVAKFTLNLDTVYTARYTAWPKEEIDMFFKRNLDKFPVSADEEPLSHYMGKFCEHMFFFNVSCEQGWDRIRYPDNDDNEQVAKEKRIREYIEKRRANLVGQTLRSPYGMMHEADVFDLILHALDTRAKCKRIAEVYLERDFERGRADGDGQGPCQVSPQDLYCVLASQRVTPGDIIHAMISVAPQHALKYRDHRSKRNLLHVATYAGPFRPGDPLLSDPHATEEKNAQKPLDVIRRLIELRPAMLNQEDSNGLTPLSRLILFDTTGHNPGGQPGQPGGRRWKGEAQIAAIVKLMCEEPFKKCVAKPRSKGAKELPLHLAAGCQMDPKVVADIIEAFPEGIDKPCREGYTALFHCISTMGTGVRGETTRALTKNAIKIINHMVKVKPALARTPRVLHQRIPGAAPSRLGTGITPLHMCIEYGLNDAVVIALLAADKDCAKDRNVVGNLPIHQALKDGASNGHVRKIMKAYPGATKEPGEYGWLPLHFALASGCDSETVRMVLRANPEAARALVIDADGGAGGIRLNEPAEGITALHLASERPDVQLVKDVVAAAPAMATHVNVEFGLPLHHAVSIKAPLGVIKELVAAFPEGTRVSNADGRIPLHCGAMVHTAQNSHATLKFLVESYPDSIHVLDHNGKSAADLLGSHSETARLLIQGISELEATRAARRAERTAARVADLTSRANDAAANAANRNPVPNEPAPAIPPGGMDTISLLSRMHQGSPADLSGPELDRLIEGVKMATRDAKYENQRRPLEEDILDQKEDWMCPIGHVLLRDPVKAKDGFTYERKKIARWMRRSRTESGGDEGLGRRGGAKWKSPMTGAYFKDFAVEPNDDMRTQIEAEIKRRIDALRQGEESDSDDESDEGEETPIVAGVAVPRKGKVKKRGASGGSKQTPARQTRRLNANATVGVTPMRLR